MSRFMRLFSRKEDKHCSFSQQFEMTGRITENSIISSIYDKKYAKAACARTNKIKRFTRYQVNFRFVSTGEIAESTITFFKSKYFLRSNICTVCSTTFRTWIFWDLFFNQNSFAFKFIWLDRSYFDAPENVLFSKIW